MKPGQPFADLPALAAHLRGELENKKTILLYAYNGTGKTRLSMAFKNLGKHTATSELTTESGDVIITEAGEAIEVDTVQGDTLYFNAFTEDLFHWDNDLDGDSDRRLTLNAASRFFAVTVNPPAFFPTAADYAKPIAAGFRRSAASTVAG